MPLKETIIAIRKNKGWTQSELSTLVGVSRDMIGKYERGDVTPPLEVIIRLAEVLECSLDYLVGLTNENPERSPGSIPGRIKPILAKFEQLSSADRSLIVTVMDALIIKAKIQSMQE